MFMKKIRILSLILALTLAFQWGSPAVSAAPPEPAASSVPSEPSVPPETTLPVETEPTMPAGFQGDASVEYGSRTLDAKKPLSDTDDYTAKASAALLYDLGSDTLVFAQEPDAKLYPASLTKVMTCLLTLEMEPDLDKVVTVTRAGLQGMEPGGSNAALKVDEEITVRNLLYCLMVKSANDAASVLAVHNSGSIEAFVDKMNERALEIGCTGTHFVNPHGLHDENHYTTARDMAKIMREAVKQPLFEEIFSTKEYFVPATNLSDSRELKTTNYLIRNAGYPQVLDSRVIGGKTGFTTPAGRCLVAIAEKNGMKLLSVVMGTKAQYGPDGYSFLRYGNFEETSDLLDFAYERYTTMQVLTTSQIAGQFAVSGGEHNAFGAITEPMSASVPIGSDYNTIRYEYTITGSGLTAPVAKGQDIGVVRVWYGNTCLAQQTLLSASDVAVQKAPAKTPAQKDGGDSLELWNRILIGVLIVVAIIFVLMVILRFRAAAARKRRRRARRNPSDRTRRRR